MDRYDLRLRQAASLKQKRSVIKGLIADLRRRTEVAAAESGHLDLRQRSEVSVAVVGPDADHCRHVLDRCSSQVDLHPEIEVLQVTRHWMTDNDERPPDADAAATGTDAARARPPASQ